MQSITKVPTGLGNRVGERKDKRKCVGGGMMPIGIKSCYQDSNPLSGWLSHAVHRTS